VYCIYKYYKEEKRFENAKGTILYRLDRKLKILLSKAPIGK